MKRLLLLLCLITSLWNPIALAQTISDFNLPVPPSFQRLSIGNLSNITSKVGMYTGKLSYGNIWVLRDQQDNH